MCICFNFILDVVDAGFLVLSFCVLFSQNEGLLIYDIFMGWFTDVNVE